jgi:hypothetical protein
MSSSARGNRFLDHLSSPLTLLPVAAGLSLLIIAWVVKAKTLFIFLGVASCLAGVVILFTQWLFFGEDPKLAGVRKEFSEGLEAALRADPRALSQEARASGTAAAIER